MDVANPLANNAGRGKEKVAAVSSETEKNKAIVRRFEEQLARGNLDVIDELVAPDFVDRSLLPGQGPTREDFKRSVAEILDAFCITSFTIEEQIAEGDTVVTKYTERSVIRGEFAGLPPTGTEETFEGIYIHRVSDEDHRGVEPGEHATHNVGAARARDTRARAHRAGP